jgi:hypothetical protein
MNGTGIFGKLPRKQRKGTIDILVRGKYVIADVTQKENRRIVQRSPKTSW